MAHVHYKFSSKLSYDMVVFDGPHTTLGELKRQIMGKEKLRAADCDLQITNAQTKREYTVDDDLIPKGSSVIVRRIPIIGARPSSNNKANNIQRSDVQLPHAFGASRAMDDQKSTSTLSFFSKMANLADADVPEEDKLKVLMSQSICDSMNLTKKSGSLPGNYTCYRCGLSGHHIRNCPTIGDKNVETPLKIKKSTGIPRSFMVEVDDPSIKGAMLTNCGRYAIPAIDAEAYAIGKKEKPLFVQELESKEDPIPDELLCVICRDLLCDSVVIPCCGNSYCDDCIRTTLLESEDHVCPTCNQSDVSPDTLIANKFLRQAVNNFKKERGYANKKQPAATQSQNINTKTPTPKLLPTTPLPTSHGLLQKPQNSRLRQQDPLQVYPKAAKTPPLPQVPVVSQATCDNTASISSDSVHNSQGTSAKDNLPSSVSCNVPAAAPPQLTLLDNNISGAEQLQSVSVNQPASSSSSGLSQSSKSQEGSSSSAVCTGSWNESIKQEPSPPSPFSPSMFHMNLPAHQSYECFPPGYPPPTPMWMPPALPGSPIPSLISPTMSVPMEWYRHQRKKSSPHRASSSRRSSTHSKAKSKSSQSYSHSSSHSESRSRSRSKGRSRHRSPYSRRRDHRSRSRPSYTFGYKRSHSPTPSSSSSPRGAYQSKSPKDHRRNRHHSKRSSSSSRRRGDHCRRDALGSNHQADQQIQSSNLELDRERYLQWKKEYTEWCEKYFSSYVSHFHQLPFPPLLGLPPACPQWEDKEGTANHFQASCSHYRTQGKRTGRRDDPSPSSDSSSCSRSPPSHSSSDSHSSPSQSPGRSSPSQKESHCSSPPSQSSCDGLSARAEERNRTGTFESCTDNDSHLPGTHVKNTESVDVQPPAQKHGGDSDLLKQEQREMKAQEVEGWEGSSFPHVVDSDDENRNNKKIKTEIPGCGHEVSNTSDALESVQQYLTPDKNRPHETKDKEEKSREKEKTKRGDKDPHSGQVEGGSHNVKARKEPSSVDKYPKESSKSSRGHDSRSTWNRKRQWSELQRNDRERSPAVKRPSSKSHKTETAQNPESLKSESPKAPEVTKEKKKSNTCHPTKEDIWEGGIKVKPQKKINININLDTKRKDDGIQHQDMLNIESLEEKTQKSTELSLKEETMKKSQTETETNGETEAISQVEALFDQPAQSEEAEVAQMWDQTCLTDASKVVLENTTVYSEAEDDFSLWHCALSGAEKDEEADTRGIGGQSQEMDELATRSRQEEENKFKKFHEAETTRDKINVCGEEDSSMLTSQTSKDECHPQQQTTADNHAVGQCGAEKDDKKNLDENSAGQAPDERNEQVLTSVFHSNLERKDQEEQNEGAVHPDIHPVALGQPSVTVTIGGTEGDGGPHRQRSTEMDREQDRVTVMEREQEERRNQHVSPSNRGVLPSSGKDQTRSVSSSHREPDRERKRDEERRSSKEHKREKDKVRSRDRESEHSRVSPAQKGKPSSRSSASHDREREGSSRCSSDVTSRRSGAGRRSTDLTDQTSKKPSRDTSPARKSSHQDPSRAYRHQPRSVEGHHSSSSRRRSKDKDLLLLESSRESPTAGRVPSKSRNESKTDKKDRELNTSNKSQTGSKSGRDHREIVEQERVRKHEEEVFHKPDGETKLGRR